MKLFTEEELITLDKAGRILAGKRIQLARDIAPINYVRTMSYLRTIDKATANYPNWHLLEDDRR